VTSCAVVPAAGRGSRLSLDVPKILAPVGEGVTVWSVLRARLLSVVDRVHVVLSPHGLGAFDEVLGSDPDRGRITTSVQEVPLGMGDAVFGSMGSWVSAQTILVVWGDQIHVSRATLCDALSLHGGRPRRIVLPVVSVERPYVEYRFGPDDSIIAILESREGDACAPGGLSDVGTFALSTESLDAEWRAYESTARKGSRTGEINFLPFIRFLSVREWQVRRVPVLDPKEARGINTPEDLSTARVALGMVGGSGGNNAG